MWCHLKGCKGDRNFLFPVHALSKVFRAKMMAALTKELSKTGAAIAQNVRKAAMSKDWVIYSRPPAKGVEKVLEYIGRYAYRVAICNSRIKDVTPEGLVTYDWKDYRAGGYATMDCSPPRTGRKCGKCNSSLEGHPSPKSGRKSHTCRYAGRKVGVSAYALT